MITYGEAWFNFKKKLNSLEHKFDEKIEVMEHKKRMSRKEASKYYGRKFKKYFKKEKKKREVY